MLTTGKSKPSAWPGLRSPSQREPPPRLISVTGGQSKTPQARNNNHSDSEPEPDGYVPAPAYSQSFSDAIALALEKASISEKDSTGKFITIYSTNFTYLRSSICHLPTYRL